MVVPFWRSEHKVYAWTMLLAVFALNMSVIYVMVILNRWNGKFYDSLQSLQKENFTSLLLQFLMIAMSYVVLMVTKSYMEASLAFKWRIWLTNQVLSQWLHNNTFCRLFLYNTKNENPDQRISQDLARFTASSLSLCLNIVTQLILSITFGVILWNLSTNLRIPLPSGTALDIPGYMLWVTIAYVVFSTFVIYKFGKPLVLLDYTQERVEADFRFSLMRIRERRDEISLLGGALAELKFLQENIIHIVKNYKEIIGCNIYVNAFQYFFANLSTLMPILAAAPMLFAGTITLGILMQIVNAFNRVENSLMLFASNFQDFASWKATFNRIVNFKFEMLDLENKSALHTQKLKLNISNECQALEIKNVVLNLPDTPNLAKFNFTVLGGEKVLIMGPSGMGKSTLLKCLAGYWPYASGEIIRPFDVTIIAQKPYFPISTLAHSLLYPHLDANISDAEIKRVLLACSLPNLINRLDEVSDWNVILSLGEQQRLNFARLIIAKPSWVVLDEPTSAMDKPLEKKMFEVLFAELPSITVLTIGHSVSLKEVHTRCIDL